MNLLLIKGDMIFLFEKYIEVYSTVNMEKFFAAKNILANNNIQYKDTSINNQLRLSLNNFRGDNYLLSRDGTIRSMYSLSVKKKDEYKARKLLKLI